MSDSEDDYMSDKFLGQEKDVRPSLLFNKKIEREHTLYKKALAGPSNKNSVSQEQLLREQGLSTQISVNNKGFEMLKKMGFKEGSGLGKTGGITEPIIIKPKNDHTGLGLASFKEEKIAKKRKLKEKTEEQREKLFRSAMAEKMSNKLFHADFGKAQRCIESFDNQNEISKPAEPYFWTQATMATLKEKVESDSSESEDEEINLDQLENMLHYLRTQYFYCLYCSILYENEQDLENSCPGIFREDHNE